MSDELKPTPAADAEAAPVAESSPVAEAAPAAEVAANDVPAAPAAEVAADAAPAAEVVAEGAATPAASVSTGAPATLDAVAGDDDDDDEVIAPAAPTERRGPTSYVESEGGRASRIGAGVKPSDVTYKNIALLSRFLDRRGRILSRRKTRVTAKVQRRVAQAVKRARHLALLPYTADQTRVVRKRR